MADFTALKNAIQTYIKQNGNEDITGDILQEILLSVVTTLGDSAINNLVTALNDEVAARQNADGTLQQNITNEATARSNADTALSDRLGSTITAENTAADQIGAEAEARSAADTVLQGLIDGITNNIENGYVYAGIATPSSTPATGKVFYLALTAGTYTNFGNTEVSQGLNILKYNGSAWSLDAFIGIDDELTPSSNKLPKSGNVLENIIKNGSAFDLSAYNAVDGVPAAYADLDAALTALNALPAVYKQGGMSLRFVHTSDNKYVQYRLMSSSFNTTVANWQGVDDVPTAGSENLVKSGGIAKALPILLNARLDQDDNGKLVAYNGRVLINKFFKIDAEPSITCTPSVLSINKYYFDSSLNFLALNTYTSSCKFVVIGMAITDGIAIGYNDIANHVVIINEIKYDCTPSFDREENILKSLINSDVLPVSSLCVAKSLKKSVYKYLFDKRNILPYNEEAWTKGSINVANGQEISSDFYRTDFISVTILKVIFKFYLNTNNRYFRLYKYDSARNYIGYVDNINSDTDLILEKNCSFVRFVVSADANEQKANIFNFFDVICINDSSLDNKTKSYENDNLAAVNYTKTDANGIAADNVITSEFIPIKADEWYLLHTDIRCCCKYVLYNSERDIVYTSPNWENTTGFKTTSSTAFIRITLGRGVNGILSSHPSIFDEYLLPVLKKMADTDLMSLIFKNVDADFDPNTKRLTTDYIYVPNNTTFQITVADGYLACFICYTAKGEGRWISTYAQTQILNTGNYNYIRLYVKKSDETVLTPDDAFRGLAYMMDDSQFIYKKDVKEIKLSQWNIGCFNNGSTDPERLPDEDIDTAIPSIKNVLTELCADIMFLNEYENVINQGNQGHELLNTYNTLLQQFYPYYYIVDDWMAIFSKYPLVLNTKTLSVGSRRRYITGYVTIQKKQIGVLLAHSTPSSVADRISEHEVFANELSSYNNAIFAGDTNIGNNSESDADIQLEIKPFVDEGFALGNIGYWGNLPTHNGNNHPLDNIMVKGFNLDRFSVGEDRSVSDHYPVKAKITTML